MLKRKISAAVMAVCMVCGMAACEKNDVPAAQAAQQSSTSISGDETNFQTVKSDTEILMPDGLTNEDFFNFFVINGKTLTLPTTLNELMEFDDKFTYEVVDYIDGSDGSHIEKKGFGVNVYYNNKFLFATVIYSEKNDEKAMLDFPMCVVIFDKEFCQKAGLDVAASCGLDYNSTYDDIEKIFGVPNAESAYSNMVKYIFSDSEYSYVLLFEINDESKQIEKFDVGMYSLD